MSATQHDKAFFLALGRVVCSIIFGTVPPILSPKMLKTQNGMLAFFGTAPPIFTPQMFKKQNGMLTFFGTVPPIVSPNMFKQVTLFSRFWCHFPSRGQPWSLPGSLGYPGGVPGRFFDGF